MSASSFKIECDVFTALCWSIGTPVAYKALKALQREDWLYLTSIQVSPSHYVSAYWFGLDAQIAAFFKKFPGFDLGIDLKAKAVESFYDSEYQCYHTNERLSPLCSDSGHYGARIQSLVATMRKKVKFILGKAPVDLNGRFGPGSTFLNHGDKITTAHKLSDDYTATRQASAFLHLWDETAWSRYAACGLSSSGDNFVAERSGIALHSECQDYAIRDFEYVKGNRFTTVPKDATKDRGICVEPSLNVFFQLAVGNEISLRLKRKIGWDKSTCEAYHKQLARIGSLTGAVATIDLSSASDSLCTNLVKLLLPKDWYRLLSDLRSPYTLIDNKWVRLEKFSSMGNGYTFELETLVFRVIVDSIHELEASTEDPYTPGLAVSVYGDDIVCPTSIASSVLGALSFFGFKKNDKKTFINGRFRESCGGDYFAGYDVRPFFLKVVCDEPHRNISLANGLRRASRLFDGDSGLHHYRSAWFKCLDSIPRQIRICRGPEHLGDLVIHDEPTQWRATRTRNGIRYFRVWRPVYNRLVGWDQFRPGVVLAAALLGVPSGSPKITSNQSNSREVIRSGVVPRIGGSYVSGYRFGRVAYS